MEILGLLNPPAYFWNDHYENNNNYILEYGYPTNPLLADTDGDGFNDSIESYYGSDPNNPAVTPNTIRPAGRLAAWGTTNYNLNLPPTNLVVDVSARGTGLAVTSQGSLVAWGRNTAGETNQVPSGIANAVQVAMGHTHCVALKGDGSVVSWGDISSGLSNVPAGLKAVQVAASWRNSAAVAADGKVYVWGVDYDGQMPVPITATNARQVAVGWGHVLVLKQDGTVMGWGRNSDGERNIPAGLTNVVQVGAQDTISWALKRDGGVAVWGRNSGGIQSVPGDLGFVTKLAGGDTMMAIGTNGNLRLWGSNIPGDRSIPAGISNVVAASLGDAPVIITTNLGSAPVITSTNSFLGQVGVAFSNTVTASGTTPITFGGSNLPTGLNISTNGLISGTPTTAGTNIAALTASNAFGTTNQTATFVITKGTPVISNWPSASPITYGQALSNSVLTGGSANVPGAFAWVHPTNKPNTGTTSQSVSFTPSAISNYNSVTSNISVVVNLAAPTGLSYTPSSVTGTVGAAISNLTPAVTGAGITYSISPTLPAGLALNTSTGVISGTPTTVATSATYTITASNIGGSTSTQLTIVVNLPQPTGLSYTPSSVTGTVGTAISNLTPAVTGTGITYSISPSLPAGLAISSSTGLISGTSTRATTSTTYTITASNSGGNTTAQVTILINKASSVLTWAPSPAAGLTYPAPLSSTQLNATSSVPGTFIYNPASGTVLNAGTNTLVATFTPTDTANYTSGLTTTNTVVVGKGSQTITFAPMPGQQIGTPPFDPGATASSGLPVSYLSSNTNVAHVVNGTLEVVGVGTSVITASQPGNGNYQPASPVTQTLEVYATPIAMQFVEVGDAGNPADPATGFGQVNATYRIGTYEVTLGQYAEFLNAVAANDPYALFHPAMETNPAVRGILRSGSAGSYRYSVIPGSANKPVTHVSWFDAARYCNWLHNGATHGASTETGAYILNGATNGTVTRSISAKFNLPSENQWYKAGHYDASAGRYWRYATRADTLTSNHANISGSYTDSQGRKLTDAGFFANSVSSYGTHDQAGNVSEWTDDLNNGQRVIRSGSWQYGVIESADRNFALANLEGDELGFRVAASGLVTNGPLLPAKSEWNTPSPTRP